MLLQAFCSKPYLTDLSPKNRRIGVHDVTCDVDDEDISDVDVDKDGDGNR